jgi:uncharacterized protein YjbI with pentapeptide repeats
LSGANLSGTNLSTTALDRAIDDLSTQFPETFDPDEAGADLREDELYEEADADEDDEADEAD